MCVVGIERVGAVFPDEYVRETFALKLLPQFFFVRNHLLASNYSRRNLPQRNGISGGFPPSPTYRCRSAGERTRPLSFFCWKTSFSLKYLCPPSVYRSR